MKAEGNKDLTTEELVAYLEGEVTPFEATRIERQLQGSVVARQRLDSLLHIRDALVHPIPELEALDLVPAIQHEMAKIAPAPVERRPPRWWTTMPWVIAAASLCLVVGLGLNRRAIGTDPSNALSASIGPSRAMDASHATAEEREFRAKSASTVVDPARWAGLQIYRVQQGGRPERVQKSLASTDGLLFSYTNLGRTPFDYLMIFAVDARGEIRWFHPAYMRHDENPTSIPIRKGEADVPLPELIHHDLPAGPLELHALFSSRPMSVLAVEAAVARGRPNRRLAEPDTVDQVLTVQVEP